MDINQFHRASTSSKASPCAQCTQWTPAVADLRGRMVPATVKVLTGDLFVTLGTSSSSHLDLRYALPLREPGFIPSIRTSSPLSLTKAKRGFSLPTKRVTASYTRTGWRSTLMLRPTNRERRP
jgi:hypothetical protein